MEFVFVIFEILKSGKHSTTFVTFPSTQAGLAVATIRSIFILKHLGFEIVRDFIKTSIASGLAGYLHIVVLLYRLLKHVVTCFS
jgi:hypothetical protein